MESTSSAKVQIDRVRAIEDKKDSLMEIVETFFNQRRTSGVNVVPIDRSQFENILRVSMMTGSVKEIINFIRYQTGREKNPNRGWRNGNFGENLISKISEIARLGGSDPYIAIRLVQLFLGFLSRHAVYESAGATERSQDDESE